MKIIKNITALFLISAIAASCSSDFLELDPPSYANVESFYKNEKDIEQAVIAAYAALQSRGQYAQQFLYFMEVRSDNSYVEDITKSSGQEGNLDLFREAPTNNYLNSVWRVCYAGIQRCNIVLNRIDDIQMDANLKSVRKGEVKFIRALTYFNIVRMWGEIPLVLDEIDNVANAYNHTRQPVSVVYDAIIADLEESIIVLPVNQADVGRVTKGAALTLLGKVYLTLERWEDVVSTLKQVETLGYEMLTNYADVFDSKNENNKESIFEVQFKGGVDGEGSLFLRLHTPLGNTSLLGGVGGAGVGDNLPTQDLYDAFGDGDLRKPVTVGMLPDGRLHTNKFNAIPVNTNDEDNNFIVLRYSDVFLMMAEAMNEVGYVADGEAFGYLNAVRSRAGLPSLSSNDLSDQSAFRETVYLERRLEFAFENQRWFDLLRTGKAIEVMSNYEEIRAPLIIENKHTLFPIPQAQIDIINNPDGFVQNPGY